MFVDLSTSIVTTKDQWNESTNRWTGMYAMRAYTCMSRCSATVHAAMSVIPCSQIYMRRPPNFVIYVSLLHQHYAAIYVMHLSEKIISNRNAIKLHIPDGIQLYLCANPNGDRHKARSYENLVFPQASFALDLFFFFLFFFFFFFLIFRSFLYVRT